jgi:hypothetical protein
MGSPNEIIATLSKKARPNMTKGIQCLFVDRDPTRESLRVVQRDETDPGQMYSAKNSPMATTAATIRIFLT